MENTNLNPENVTYNYEEKLWNEKYLFPITKNWNTAIVLCCYKPLYKEQVKKLAQIFANKVDHKYLKPKKGKAYNINQRFEKLQMLEYGPEKRGWHINMFLNCPESIDQSKLINGMRDIWLNLIVKPWQVEFIKKDPEWFFAEKAGNGFYKYCVKKRSQEAAIQRPDLISGQTSTPNDLLITSTLTIHESNINS